MKYEGGKLQVRVGDATIKIILWYKNGSDIGDTGVVVQYKFTLPSWVEPHDISANNILFLEAYVGGIHLNYFSQVSWKWWHMCNQGFTILHF